MKKQILFFSGLLFSLPVFGEQKGGGKEKEIEPIVVFFCVKSEGSKNGFVRDWKEVEKEVGEEVEEQFEEEVEEEFEDESQKPVKEKIKEEPELNNIKILPDCESTGSALQRELEISGLEFIQIPTPPSMVKNPDDPSIAQNLAEGGSSFVVWSDEFSILRIYDAINRQLIKIDMKIITNKSLEPDETAIFIKNVMGTSLFADLDAIEGEEKLQSLALNDKKISQIMKVEKVRKEAAKIMPSTQKIKAEIVSRPEKWFPLFSVGYTLLSYPQVSLVFHGANIDLLFPLPKNFEITLGGIFTGHSTVSTDPADFVNDQYVVSLMGSFLFIKKRIVSSWAGLVVSTGISRTLVRYSSGDGETKNTVANGAIGAALGLRIRLYKSIFTEIKFGLDNLFNHEIYTYYGNTKFELARIRIHGGLSLLVSR